MPITYYKTDFGLFTVINDNTIYNAITDSASGRDNVPWERVYATIACNGNSFDANTYNLIAEKIPHLVLKQVNAPNGQANLEIVNYSLIGDEVGSDRIVYTQKYYYSKPADLRWSSGFKYGSSSPVSMNNTSMPYGYFGVLTAGTARSNYIWLSVLVCDESFMNFKGVGIRAYPSGNDYNLSYTYTAFTVEQTVNTLRNFFNQAPPFNTDPYDPAAGNSEPGGGDGEYDDDSESNPISPLPTASFVDAGFCRIYNPSLSQLKALSQYMWTDTTFLQTVINHLKQLLENPMDAIISLSLLPVPIPQGSDEEVKVMYIPTGVYMPPAISQFVDVDCGTLTISKNIGCALDYNPYTRIHVYLPYIGQVTLNTDEVMGKTLHLIYRVDIVTGICVAFILVNQNVMYVFSGHCSVSQPLSSADFSGYLNAMISAAKLVGGVVAGAAGAPELAAGISGSPAPRSKTTTTTIVDTERNPKTGRQITSGTEKVQKIESSEGASFGELASHLATNTVSQVVNSKMVVEHASGFGGNSGYIAQRYPYVIIERPRLCNPKEYGAYNGYPSMLFLNLGKISGYTEVQQVQLTGINATNPELSEISELLKTGVIL